MLIMEWYKIPNTAYCYKNKAVISGLKVAKAMSQPMERVYKTPVTMWKSRRMRFCHPLWQKLQAEAKIKFIIDNINYPCQNQFIEKALVALSVYNDNNSDGRLVFIGWHLFDGTFSVGLDLAEELMPVVSAGFQENSVDFMTVAGSEHLVVLTYIVPLKYQERLSQDIPLQIIVSKYPCRIIIELTSE